MIELKNFSKIYPSQTNGEKAVEDVSFICKPGTVTGLVGENGSGKSTIIKAVTGNHYASEGFVYIYDRDGLSYDASENPEKIKQLCGYVPELPFLPEDMKVESFLNYVAELHGVNKTFVMNAVEKCSLQPVLKKRIKALSKGFKQRVSFAQSLIFSPYILVLDEPFSGLDPAQIIQMRNLILKEAEDKTVLISTHNLAEVHNLCNQVLIMKEGRLVASGSEESIIKETDSKTFEEAFLKL